MAFQSDTKRWFVGADHAGLELKNDLVAMLRDLGDEVEDCGTHTDESVDYPDFAAAVCKRVAGGGGLGLLVCGTGIGIAIAANKVNGIRAATVTCPFSARATRQHNNANVIAMGARVIGAGVARDCLSAFRDAEFEGGRHQRRVDKISALELPQSDAGASDEDS